MSKIYPYTIYHLDHELLMSLSRKNYQSLDETEQKAVISYKKLMSNFPRDDDSIKELFYTKHELMLQKLKGSLDPKERVRQQRLQPKEDAVPSIFEIMLEDLEKQPHVPDSNAQQKVKRKVSSAIELFKAGYYAKVAEVDSSTADEAVRLTTNISKYWSFSSDKKVNTLMLTGKSTNPYDLIARFDEFFLKMPLGYIDCQQKEYANELV